MPTARPHLRLLAYKRPTLCIHARARGAENRATHASRAAHMGHARFAHAENGLGHLTSTSDPG
eukprot:9962691-Lingulodinium_polyedra.AAC.1